MIEQMVSKVTLATGLQIWAVTGHDNIRRLLTDIRASASRKHANFTFYINAPRRGHLNRRSLARM